jgi:ArsR family transcriptional regulator, arsenate/arsenite/antimonite-responsive transcriptional repressor
LTDAIYFDIFGNMKVEQAVKALGALAQDSRLSIYRALVQQGPSGLAAGALSGKLDVPAPTMSFHLSQLSNAGLIKSTRDGRSIIYAADYDAMRELLNFLTANCCRGENCTETVSRPRSSGKSR